jgi:Glycosyl transferases group 1
MRGSGAVTLLSRAARLGRPSTLRSLAREFRWRASEPPPPLAPSWRLPSATSSPTLVWPERYSWPLQAAWVEPMRLGFESLADLRREQLFEAHPRLLRDGVPFALELGGRRLDAVIDYGDDPQLAPELLDEFDLIFKMQYLHRGYGSERVVPGGFVTRDLSIYRFLPRLRELRAQGTPRWDSYGRFGSDKAALRHGAVELLRSQSSFTFRGGFRKVRYLESLIEAARARTCIDLPGKGPLCFRLVEYLAIGCAVVSPPHACRLPVPLEENRHVVFCEPDLSDLAEVVGRLIQDPARLAALGREASLYFDRFLDYRQLSRYYLATCLERL